MAYPVLQAQNENEAGRPRADARERASLAGREVPLSRADAHREAAKIHASAISQLADAVELRGSRGSADAAGRIALFMLAALTLLNGVALLLLLARTSGPASASFPWFFAGLMLAVGSGLVPFPTGWGKGANLMLLRAIRHAIRVLWIASAGSFAAGVCFAR